MRARNAAGRSPIASPVVYVVASREDDALLCFEAEDFQFSFFSVTQATVWHLAFMQIIIFRLREKTTASKEQGSDFPLASFMKYGFDYANQGIKSSAALGYCC